MPVKKCKRRGRWYFRKRHRLPDGTRVDLYGMMPKEGNTKVGAEAAELDAIARARSEWELRLKGGAVPSTVPTFGEWWPVFLRQCKVLKKNSPSELESKRSIWDVHLKHRLEHVRLDAFRKADAKNLTLELSDETVAGGDPRSPKRVNNILTVVRSMLRAAVDDEVIPACPRIPPLPVTEPEIRFLSHEELDRMLEAATYPNLKMAFLIAADTGLRKGEIQALTWDDVDFFTHKINVTKSYWRGVLKLPKGKRSRQVPMTSRLERALKQHRMVGPKAVIANPDDGLPYTGHKFMDNSFKSVRTRTGIQDVGWHTFRHTFCSHLAMAGAPITAIQALAGHVSIKTTQRYLKFAKDKLASVISLLGRDA